MKKVEEFQKTQNLMNEYDKLEGKITNYKKEQEKLSTEKNIIKQTYTKGIKKEEYKGYEDFEEKLKQDVDEYHIDPLDLEKEYEDKIQKIDSDLEKVEETHKFFCNDNNFKTITMEMKEMEEAMQEAEKEKNIEIAKLDLQWNELMAKKDFDGALEKRQEKESTIKRFDKDIKELKDRFFEYAKFKEKLNEKLRTFSVEDFRKINEMTTGPAPTEPAPTGPAPTEPAPTGPAPTGPAPTGPAPTGPAPTGPAPTGPAPTGPAPTGPAPTGPAPTGPAPTGPASTGPAPTGPAPTGPAPTGPAPTGPAPRDVKINIGKEVTYSFEKDGQTIEGKLNLKTLKKQLDPDIAIDIARKLRNLQELKAEDKDYDEKMKKTNELAKKVNPMVFEALYKLDKEIGKDQPEYLKNYLKTIINNDPSMLKTDIVYDENQYKKRSIFDRIKALSFIDKALNGKEINKIEEYADKDETNKMARIIRINKKETKKIGNGDDQQNHSDFVEKLKDISAMQIDDPEDKLTPEQIQQNRKRKQQESSTDYIDKFAGKDDEGR